MNDLMHFRHSDPSIGFRENANYYSKVDTMIQDMKKDKLNIRLFDS